MTAWLTLNDTTDAEICQRLPEASVATLFYPDAPGAKTVMVEGADDAETAKALAESRGFDVSHAEPDETNDGDANLEP